jgi:signal transduction histidine kinase
LVKNEKGENVSLNDRPIQIVLTTSKKFTSTTASTYFYVRKDGSKFPAEVTVTPVVLNEKLIGTIEVFRDITKEMEIDRAKSELLSLASHQLRTPLSTISWYAEALLKEYTGAVSVMQKNYLDQIYRTVHKMIRLVNDFLNVSRIELGTLPADPEPVNLAEIAKSAIDELGAMIKEKRVKVNQNYAEQIPIINADPNHMRMIFQNLLTNAVKYTETDGEIWVEILTEQERVVIKVIDTGCGIPKSQQSKIFTKLFRADNVKGEDTEGTGLGLYIVKSIVTQANGEIWFKSEEGKGSIFYIALPCSVSV